MGSVARALTSPRAVARWGLAAAAATMLLLGCSPTEETGSETPPSDTAAACDADADQRRMRGAWLTTVRNIDWPSESGLSAEEQKEELEAHLDAAVDMNLNAVFLHARPTADAVYDSDLEPWARYLTGKQGGDPGYDPLEYAVEQAHARGLEMHAWFNPYRIGLQDPDVANLTDDHPVVENPDWLIEHGDEAYADPGNPEVREWVGKVIMDVVERYDIDGVHFDDFFYPYPVEGEEFDDDASWKAHGEDFDDRGDWRRDNVDQLMRDVHGQIQQSKPWVSFGVSPFGIWRNESTDPTGSPSSGLQSYDSQFADTRTWIEEGTIDYVAPQLYWERGFSTADYETMTNWWAEEVEDTDVDLYIGQAAYRLGDDGWTGEEALSTQLDHSGELAEVGGDIYFSIKDMRNGGAAVDHLINTHYDEPALPPVIDSDQGPLTGTVQDIEARTGDDGVEVEWSQTEHARFYAVHRLSEEALEEVAKDAPEDRCAALTQENLVALTGKNSLVDTEPDKDTAGYVVTALDDFRAKGPVGEPAPLDG